MRFPRLTGLAVLLAVGLSNSIPAFAQQQRSPSSALGSAPGGVQGGVQDGQAGSQPQPLQLPPPPVILPLPRGTTPPPAVVAVMDVSEVLRRSTAAQHVQQVIGDRQRAFNEELQREQAAIQTTRQELEGAQGKVPPAQLRARAQALQQRATAAQRRFAERGRALQETTQYVQAQIQRTLTAVIQQASQSKGVNLLLHRGGVIRGLLGLDLTDLIADQLNRALPDVVIPPDGVRPPSAPVGRPGSVQAPATQGSARRAPARR